MKTKQKGAIGEHTVALDLLKRGFRVLKPVNDDSPYDYLVDMCDGRFIKVQVKLRNSWFVPRGRVWSDSRGRHAADYTSNEVDVIAMTDTNTMTIAYVPLDLVGISLKDSPSGSWSYIKEDFNVFPCLDRYERKLRTKDDVIIGEFDVENCLLNYDKAKTIRDNAREHRLPYHLVRKLVLKMKNKQPVE